MDDDSPLLSQGSKKIGPEIDPEEYALLKLSAPIVVPLAIYCVLYKTLPAIREVLDIALIASWIAGICFVRFLGVKAIIRAINRMAERFVNPPAPNPDDTSESS